MNIGSPGLYKRFINRAIRDIKIQPSFHILDLGCGYRSKRYVDEQISKGRWPNHWP